ncbi:hypothetical protein [Dyadobacter soli]|uniref:hypothetical protein n=1 Tax=Dyadobacter soli TaxID=659014 RepID=UPI00115FBF66|nr:hypothetical protein [Dyadobacter soli]
MKGHYFLKWLFLTVLSVSVLHFREASPADRFRIEQVSAGHSYSSGKALHFEHFRPSDNQYARFAHFKREQYLRFSCLSIKLSDVVTKRPALSADRPLNRVQIQNQHFRSRTLASDDHSISHS